MIDFRYHLVSLVSVFMALAIGVVLGAGPLRESLGDTLTSQVRALRADKEALQQAVANRDADITGRDELLAGLGASLLPGQLEGSSVVVVTLPGADPEAVDPLVADLTTAGAQVTGTVQVQPSWSDPEQAAFRRELAGQLVQYLDPRPEAALGTEGELAVTLARSLVSSSGGAQRPAPAQQALDGLAAGELVTVEQEQPVLADLAVVVSGSPADAAGGEDAEWSESATSAHLAVLEQLDATGGGAVLAGPQSDDGEGGLLAALRGDAELTESVSSVDGLADPGARISVVLALREQLEGRSGQYGRGPGAQAVVPTYSAPAADEVPDDGGGDGTSTDGAGSPTGTGTPADGATGDPTGDG
jgi:hypothetical protein